MKNDKNRDYMVVRSRNKKILGRAKKINVSNADKIQLLIKKELFLIMQNI